MEEINASIGFDKKLWRQDIQGSLAHAAMLGKTGIIDAADVAAAGGDPEVDVDENVPGMSTSIS